MSTQLEPLEQTIDENLGVQLVDILYKNTSLNYDVCAFNLIEVFDHLSGKLPQLNQLYSKLTDSIRNSISHYNPDLTCLEANFKSLIELNGDLQTGEKNFYECNEQLRQHLKQSIKLIVTKIFIF